MEQLRGDSGVILLVAAGCAAPYFVRDQGGTWQQAFLAFWAVLAAPMAAIEPMLGLSRLFIRIEHGGR
jgi:hypothetical protein